MAYFKAYSKREGSSGAYIVIEGYSRKDVFEKSQRAANETGRRVTILEERTVRGGIAMDFYELQPDTHLKKQY